MRVFAHPTDKSRGLDRIAAAVKRHAPSDIKIVNSKDEADLVILFINGRREHTKIEIDRLTRQGKNYAIVQACVRSTKNPSTVDWLPLWQGAELVWSYYDLPALCAEDKMSADFNFYHAPLGIDKAFKVYPTKKKYIIATSGLGYLTESARECILAAIGVNKRVFHVGPVITNRPEVDFSNGMADASLAKNYSACEFVSGLRRIEGFELPVIEGLACGARPIVFDRPHYRHWFENLAIFIPETNRDGVVNSLSKVFKKGAKPVTKAEIKEARKRFNWEVIVKGFWEKCLI